MQNVFSKEKITVMNHNLIFQRRKKQVQQTGVLKSKVLFSFFGNHSKPQIDVDNFRWLGIYNDKQKALKTVWKIVWKHEGH